MQDHRKLRVWQEAHEICVQVYSFTADFPLTAYHLPSTVYRLLLPSTVYRLRFSQIPDPISGYGMYRRSALARPNRAAPDTTIQSGSVARAAAACTNGVAGEGSTACAASTAMVMTAARTIRMMVAFISLSNSANVCASCPLKAFLGVPRTQVQGPDHPPEPGFFMAC